MIFKVYSKVYYYLYLDYSINLLSWSDWLDEAKIMLKFNQYI